MDINTQTQDLILSSKDEKKMSTLFDHADNTQKNTNFKESCKQSEYIFVPNSQYNLQGNKK